MKRFMQVLSIASMSSVYVMQLPCTSNGHGVTIIPTVNFSATAFLRSLGVPI